ncbi:MAG: helix-turn-helix domain-containing protein [Candidatus Pacearchaeota archaeon]|jgi:sugar-specific transcriptional regulator TrmB
MEEQNTVILTSLGLIENEVKVYLFLLKSGPSLASDVAMATKLHRTHVYDLLSSLIKKTIISYVIRENRRYFQAVSPEQLKVLIENKEDELKKDEEKLGQLINELKKSYASPKEHLLVSVYESQRGFKTLLEDILKKKQEYLVLGYNPSAEESLKYFLPGFYKRRLEARVHRRAIVDPAFRGTWVKNQKMQEIRFFKYSFPMGIIIYEERVVMTILQEGGQIAIVIDNKKISDNFRKLFESIWVQAAKQ